MSACGSHVRCSRTIRRPKASMNSRSTLSRNGRSTSPVWRCLMAAGCEGSAASPSRGRTSGRPGTCAMRSECSPGRTTRARSCGLQVKGLLSPRGRLASPYRRRSSRSRRWRRPDFPTVRSQIACSCRTARSARTCTTCIQSSASLRDRSCPRPWPRWSLHSRMAGDSLIPFQRVELPGGPVSLVPVEQLQAQITELSAGADHALAQAQDFAGQAQTKMEEAGKMMADRWQEWPAQELSGQIGEVIGLQQKRANLDAGLSEVQQHPHHGLSGVFEKLRDDAESSGLQHQQQAIAQQLKVLCEQIAASAPPTTVPDADAARAEAASLVQTCTAFKADAKAVFDAAGPTGDDAHGRQRA